MSTLLKEMRIAQLSSKNEWTLIYIALSTSYLIIVFCMNIPLKKISSHCVFSQNNCGLSIPKNVDRFAVPYIWLQRQRFFCSILVHKVSFQEYLIPHGLLTFLNSFCANIICMYDVVCI